MADLNWKLGSFQLLYHQALGIYFRNGSGICFQNSNVTCGNSLGLSILPPEKGRYIISKIGERLSETRGCVQYTQQAHTWLHATHWPRDGRATHIRESPDVSGHGVAFLLISALGKVDH